MIAAELQLRSIHTFLPGQLQLRDFLQRTGDSYLCTILTLALHICALTGFIHGMQAILQWCVDVDTKDVHGWTGTFI